MSASNHVVPVELRVRTLSFHGLCPGVRGLGAFRTSASVPTFGPRQFSTLPSHFQHATYVSEFDQAHSGFLPTRPRIRMSHVRKPSLAQYDCFRFFFDCEKTRLLIPRIWHRHTTTRFRQVPVSPECLSQKFACSHDGSGSAKGSSFVGANSDMARCSL